MTVYISGQAVWDAQQRIGDVHDLGAPTHRPLQNPGMAVQAARGAHTDVVSLRLYILGEHNHKAGPVRQALLGFIARERLD